MNRLPQSPTHKSPLFLGSRRSSPFSATGSTCTESPIAIAPDELDFLGHKLLTSYGKLVSTVMAQIKEDRGTERAGLLFGAMAQLPNYLDLAAEDCGPFEVRYPEDAGGALVATGDAFPVRWRSPKEQWLLGKLREELSEGRKVLLFLRNTGNAGYVRRILRLLTDEFAEPIVFLDPRKVPTAKRERWLNENVIRPGYRILAAHPTTVQTGLNNLTAFSTAIWYQGTEGAVVTRQANGRPHRIGQTQPVRILCPFYAKTPQKTALDHHARMITATLQVDGLSLTGALEAAGASSDSDREHAAAALSLRKALYEAALRGDR